MFRTTKSGLHEKMGNCQTFPETDAYRSKIAPCTTGDRGREVRAAGARAAPCCCATFSRDFPCAELSGSALPPAKPHVWQPQTSGVAGTGWVGLGGIPGNPFSALQLGRLQTQSVIWPSFAYHLFTYTEASFFFSPVKEEYPFAQHLRGRCFPTMQCCDLMQGSCFQRKTSCDGLRMPDCWIGFPCAEWGSMWWSDSRHCFSRRWWHSHTKEVSAF